MNRCVISNICSDKSKVKVTLQGQIGFKKKRSSRWGISVPTTVVRASARWAEGPGFDPRPQKTKVFKTGGSGFPPLAQDYGNSTTIGPPVSG